MRAGDQFALDARFEPGGGHFATALAAFGAAALGKFGCIDAVETDPLCPDMQRITVDDPSRARETSLQR